MAEPENSRRRHERAKLKKGVAVGWRSGQLRGLNRAETVGLGGLFIRTANPAPVGASVELAFNLPDGEVRARAVVRHSKPGEGMGVEFVGMDHTARGRLQATLKRLLTILEGK